MNSESKSAILYLTESGKRIALKLSALYPGAPVLRFEAGVVAELWKEYRNLIFIMAAGIVVRTIASLVKDKKTDPAVVVLDEKGRFAVSLLSGHLGGANERAKEIAAHLGGEAVITTASDVNDLASLDLWAHDHNLVIEDWRLLPGIGVRLVNEGQVKVFTEIEIRLPDGFLRTPDPSGADIRITNRTAMAPDLPAPSGEAPLILRPKNLVAGIGCNSGTSGDEIDAAVRRVMDEHLLSLLSLCAVATIDKKAEEPGLVAFAQKGGLAMMTFTPGELNSVEGVAKSGAALRATGAKAVAEPAAILASGRGPLLVPKQKIGNVTVAIAEFHADQKTGEMKQNAKGKIYIVGTGPGSSAHLTPSARDAITGSDVVVGYGTYMELIRDLIGGKEVFSTGMTQEVDRCGKAVELALQGKTVSVISGGDPGIYAMAGLVFELLKAEEQKSGKLRASKGYPEQGNYRPSDLDVEVIPGISALNACAARLGAPIMHDFASISLSDRLTPWGVIEKRLEAAARADFVIVLYNPRSKGRVGQIREARDLILRYRTAETPVGIVKGAMREGEKIGITNLKNMLDHEIDMQTTVIIGNSQTFVWKGRMITPRGYEKKIKA